MKYKGNKPDGSRYMDVLVFPRPAEKESIALWVRALDEEWDVWNEKCPAPPIPVETGADGEVIELEEDEGYLAQLQNWGVLQTDFLVVFSITFDANPLEWDSVKLDKPSTWRHWRTEILELGLSRIELNKVLAKCIAVNSLNEDLMDQARADFLRGHQKG